MKKIRIAVVLPIPEDPTSWYRGLAPLVKMSRDYDDIEVHFPQQLSWSTLYGSDVLFLQRPATPDHFNALSFAKNMGLKVIVDMDDDNLAVPKDNPQYPMYSQMPIKESVLKLARYCDVLTVTTEFMKKKYGIYNKNTVIIPNALDDKIVNERAKQFGEREKKFLWRGTASHNRNILSVGMQILNVANRHPDWRFVFFGMDPIDITDRIKNVEVLGQAHIVDFYKVMGQIHASVLYYPLNLNDHSQARSHISWLEGTYGNMAVLAYGNEEFNRPGILNYKTAEEFENTLEAVTRGEVDIDKCVKESWEHILENYVLSKTNAKRYEVVKSLVS